jgi:hypothetical protein
MKTKMQRVFEAVIKAVGNNMTRYQAAECAQYLLKKHAGNVKLAVEAAEQPYNIGGNMTY